MQRRKFLKTSGIFASTFYASRLKAIAGPFKIGELSLIPLDKKLDPEWIKSLYKRGFVTQYLKSRNELPYIGMPVGGIQCGTMYLGGDGRLWLWDIFNANQEGIDPREVEWDTDLHVGKKVRSRDGSAYVKPAKDIRPVEQGFAFKITIGDRTVIKKMEAEDWDEIIFEATYPMAKVRYIDKQLPIEISADVYSPFIALDEKNSGLPTTIYSFQIKNKSKLQVKVSILGWLENKVCLRSALETEQRVNKAISEPNFASVECQLQLFAQERVSAADFGTMGIMALNPKSTAQTDFTLPISETSFTRSNLSKSAKPIHETHLASVASEVVVRPNATQTAHFALAWHFPNLQLNQVIEGHGRFYNTLFASVTEVMRYVRTHFGTLSGKSHLWRETWYDSSLPWWFLERTFLNISTLATTTAHRFESGRFYAWEGVGCCQGTCTHVWQYAQAMGRIFPALEKDTRKRVDLGLSLQPDGMIWYRGEVAKSPAIDGQAGTILRIYREHQMSADDTFLHSNWDKIKRATQFVIAQDRNGDGMEDTPLENTLDAVWDGEISWLVGLCIAAVKAGEQMATEMNDREFAQQCAEYVAKGRRNMEQNLFNGEYFIHRPDAVKGRQKLGSYNTSHIDQVYGQSWAHQVGLGRILDRDKTLSALRSLWKYNFTPDVGPYIKEHVGGRPYALAGDGGMIMNTNPKNEARPYGEDVTWQIGYFHECMSGFEHQVASHLMAEGMIDESLILTRMIHDRYHAAKRNPFNEIECSDHYARAMASFGTFITACGFEYHGPKGYIRFAPRMGADDFKAPFTSAEGWGTYQQKQQQTRMKAEIHVKYGALRLKTWSAELKHAASKVVVKLDGKTIAASLTQDGQNATIHFEEAVVIAENQKLVAQYS
jgi:uncharacterized protein (DUF608 family)